MATQDFAEAFRGLGVLSCSCRRAVLFASVVDDPEAHPEKYWDDQTFWTPSLHYFNSFNLALYSGPLSGAPGFRANLTMVTRSALIPTGSSGTAESFSLAIANALSSCRARAPGRD